MTAFSLSDFEGDESELFRIPTNVLARIWFLTTSSVLSGSKKIFARSIARFNIGTCVFSVACNRIAQSSAESAQTGISSLFSAVSSSVALNAFTDMSEFFSCSLETACSYSPFESINTNLEPLAE